MAVAHGCLMLMPRIQSPAGGSVTMLMRPPPTGRARAAGAAAVDGRHRGVLRGREDRAAGVLALVQGGVGRSLEGGQVTGADGGRGRGADRGGDVDGPAVLKDDGGVEHPDQLCEALRTAVGGELQDHGELVAPEPAGRGARARPCGEPGAESLKYGVTRRVPEAVVHGLEVVGVDHHQRGVVAVAGQEAAGAGGVGVPAQEPGERVTAAGGELPVQRGGVECPAGEGQGGGDEEGARADPAR